LQSRAIADELASGPPVRERLDRIPFIPVPAPDRDRGQAGIQSGTIILSVRRPGSPLSRGRTE